jgi:tetratricopeptide (TPR) repeat protein
VKKDCRRYIYDILEAIGNIKRYLIRGASKVRKNAVIVVAIAALIVAALTFLHPIYLEHGEREDLKSQIDSSIRRADSLRDTGLFEEAIDEYKSILKMVSPKKFPDSYATTQNNLGTAYGRLADVRDKKANLEKAIHAFQEALKIHTIE